MKDIQPELKVTTSIVREHDQASNSLWLDLIVDYLYQCYFDKHLIKEDEVE